MFPDQTKAKVWCQPSRFKAVPKAFKLQLKKSPWLLHAAYSPCQTGIETRSHFFLL